VLGSGTTVCAGVSIILLINRNRFFLTVSQNSKSKENWIWRASVPVIGCLNPGIGVKPEPNTGLIWETFGLLNKLKNSATTSRRLPPNGKYFRTRRSIVASAGVLREFLAEAERSSRKWKGVTLVRVKPRKRIHGPATL
jgi:hypothetical protein